MAIIAPVKEISARAQRVDVFNPSGPRVPDGDYEYTQVYAWTRYVYAAVEPATAQRLDRLTVAGSIASATHIVTMPYIAEITSRTRLYLRHRFNAFASAFSSAFMHGTPGRRLDVLGFGSPRELGVEQIVICQEIVP